MREIYQSFVKVNILVTNLFRTLNLFLDFSKIKFLLFYDESVWAKLTSIKKVIKWNISFHGLKLWNLISIGLKIFVREAVFIS